MVPSSIGAVGLVASDTARSSDDAIEPGGPDASGDPKADHLVYVRESYVYIRTSHIFSVFKIQNFMLSSHVDSKPLLTMGPPLPDKLIGISRRGG